MSVQIAAWEVLGGTALLGALAMTTLNVMTQPSPFPLEAVQIGVADGEKVEAGGTFKERSTFRQVRDDCPAPQIQRYLAEAATGNFIPLETVSMSAFKVVDDFQRMETRLQAPAEFEGERGFLVYDFCYVCDGRLMCRTFYSSPFDVK